MDKTLTVLLVRDRERSYGSKSYQILIGPRDNIKIGPVITAYSAKEAKVIYLKREREGQSNG